MKRKEAINGVTILVVVFLTFACNTVKPGDRSGKCNVSITDAPALIGLRLRMTIPEVQSRLPALLIDQYQFGRATASLNQRNSEHWDRKEIKIEGVKGARLEFVDGQLSEISVDYDLKTRLTGEEFKDTAQEKLGLKSEWLEASDMQYLPLGGIALTAWRCTCTVGEVQEDEHFHQTNGFKIDIQTPDAVLNDYSITMTDNSLASLASRRESQSYEDEKKRTQGNFRP